MTKSGVCLIQSRISLGRMALMHLLRTAKFWLTLIPVDFVEFPIHHLVPIVLLRTSTTASTTLQISCHYTIFFKKSDIFVKNMMELVGMENG